MSDESTTPDLVELQNGLTDAANHRDLDAITSFYAPDGVWDMSPDIGEARAGAERLAWERG